jgi:hypothetical protein
LHFRQSGANSGSGGRLSQEFTSLVSIQILNAIKGKSLNFPAYYRLPEFYLAGLI